MKKLLCLGLLVLGGITTFTEVIDNTYADTNNIMMATPMANQVSLNKLEHANDPDYKVGQKVTVLVNHMGMTMKGATATIAGAYHTHVYSVDFYNSVSHKYIKNHKWVIQRELKGMKDSSTPLKAGDQVVLEANHMPGMKGATAKINQVKDTNVYMVNIPAYKGQAPMSDHRWFIQEELKPVKNISSTNQLTVKPGMTYWEISQKYGTPIKQLEKMNKWAPTQIPVNADLIYR